MKIRILISLIIMLFFIHNNIEARIGETPEQCEKRYGKSFTLEENDFTYYRKSGLIIMVNFFEGKVDMIGFRKVEENILGIAEELSDNEIQALLKVNGEKRLWKERNIISMNKEWETADGEIFAYYNFMQKFLSIAKREYLERIEAEKKTKEEEKLEDF